MWKITIFVFFYDKQLKKFNQTLFRVVPFCQKAHYLWVTRDEYQIDECHFQKLPNELTKEPGCDLSWRAFNSFCLRYRYNQEFFRFLQFQRGLFLAVSLPGFSHTLLPWWFSGRAGLSQTLRFDSLGHQNGRWSSNFLQRISPSLKLYSPWFSWYHDSLQRPRKVHRWWIQDCESDPSFWNWYPVS